MTSLKLFIHKYWAEMLFLLSTIVVRVVPMIKEPPFWDETFSWVISQNSYLGIIGATAKDTHPPIYYEVLKLWSNIFGDNIISLRSISLIFWLIACGALIIIVRDLTNNNNTKRYFFYLTFVFLQITVWLSTFVRMYTLDIALLLWAIVFFHSFIKKKDIKSLTIFSSLILLGNYTLNITLFAWGGIILFYLIYKIDEIKNFLFSLSFKKLSKEFIQFIFSQVIVFFLYLPWLLVVFKQTSGTSAKQLAWIPALQLSSTFSISEILLGASDNNIFASYIFITGVVFLILFITLYKFLFKFKSEKHTNTYFYIFSFITVISIFCILALSFKQSIIVPRTFFIATIGFIIITLYLTPIKNNFVFKAILLFIFIFLSLSTFINYSEKYKNVNGEEGMNAFVNIMNTDSSTKLIITRQQGQYPIAYQQLKYFTRSSPKQILLDSSTDTGDYIIYGKDDFIDINTLEEKYNSFYYFNYTDNNSCPSVEDFIKVYDKSIEEYGRKAEICKYIVD